MRTDALLITAELRGVVAQSGRVARWLPVARGSGPQLSHLARMFVDIYLTSEMKLCRTQPDTR